MNIRKSFLFVLLSGVLVFSALLSSCASKSPETRNNSGSAVQIVADDKGVGLPAPSAAVQPEQAAADAASGYAGVPQIVPPADDHQKLIYTLNMSMTADDPAALVNELASYVQGLNGYLSGSNMNSDDLGIYQAQATLRVPPEKLTELSQHIQSLGKVKNYNLNTNEITQEYWDISTRLESAKKQRDQLLVLLQQCKTVEETLKVRDSLQPIEQEIDSYEGQLRFMNDRVDYSTLSLTINRTPKTAVQGEEENIAIWKIQDVLKRMGSGFMNTGRFLVNAFYAILIFLSYIAIPLIILAVIAVIVIVIVRVARRKRQKS